MNALVLTGQVEAHAPKAAPPTTSTVANSGEFAIIKSQAGLNSYKLSVKEWVEKTIAIRQMQTLTARMASSWKEGANNGW